MSQDSFINQLKLARNGINFTDEFNFDKLCLGSSFSPKQVMDCVRSEEGAIL